MAKISIKLLLVIYAAVVGIVGQFAAADSADLGYPGLLVFASSVSYFSLAIAVLVVVLGWQPRIVRYWKVIFWISCADFLIGLWMDATIPQDMNATNNSSFWLTALAVVAFLAPAYFFSYVVAYKRGGQSAGCRGGLP